MTKEALTLALEALEGFYEYGYDRRECFEHITAIKEALAQPEQEPVAHLWQHGETGRTRIVMPDQIITADASWFVVGPLFLYTTPPQRTWVGLTDEEREAIANATIRIHGQDWAYATAIEAKLKEKNG